MTEPFYAIGSNATEYIKSHPDLYLPTGSISVANKLAQLLLMDCLALGCMDVHAVKDAEWWVIFSKKDWLSPNKSWHQVIEPFNSIYAMPEAGVNSIHHEVVVNAFSEDVLTAFDGEVLVIRHSEDKEQVELGKKLCLSSASSSRVVAFRCSA